MKKLWNNLDTRTLRFDGVSIVSPDQVVQLFLDGVPPAQIRVNGDSYEIQQFNANVCAEDEIHQPIDEVKIDLTWRLPKEFQDLNLEAYIFDKYVEFLNSAGYTLEEKQLADTRIALELQEINKRGMGEFICTLVYVLEVFRKEGVVWGVGRGSSCACYILFILGLHMVDCIRLDVPLEEFFHN